MAVYARLFSDVYGAVIDKLRLDTTDDLAKAKMWVNLTLAQVAVKTRAFTGSTAGTALTGGASSQALPAAIVELDYVTCSYAGIAPLLRQVMFDRLLYDRGLGTATGPPREHTLRQGTVEFWPNAAGSEILTYYGAVTPNALIGDSDVIPVPEPFSVVLEYGALVHGAEYKHDLLLMGNWEALYQSWLGQFQTYVNRRVGASGIQMEVLGVGRRHVPFDRSADVGGVAWP